jgi:branched-chain amino acid transport system permease protein
MTRFKARLGWLLLFALGAAFPLVARNDYQLTVMATAYVFALATLGLNLITGYTGQYNLAHGGFMAIGAYTVGILTVDHHWPFWVAIPFAGLLPTVVGFVVGAVSLRLKGHYFSIFTLCIGVIIALVIEKWESLTHGPVGIIGIPAPTAVGPISFESPRGLYYLMFTFLVVGTLVMHRIVTSLMGRTFMAIRNGEPLAEAIGIPLMRNKLLAFLISVFYSGIAGGLYAGLVRFIGPGLADVNHTFDMTMYMLVGGLGTLLGPLLGAVTVPWLTQSLQFLQEYRFLVFGPVLVLLIIFVPHGLVGTYLGWRARWAANARPIDTPRAGITEAAPEVNRA